jgi:hypothetical protein
MNFVCSVLAFIGHAVLRKVLSTFVRDKKNTLPLFVSMRKEGMSFPCFQAILAARIESHEVLP